jgi:hypothetical protein
MVKQTPILIAEKDNIATLNGELIHNTQSRYAEYREETNPENKKAIKAKFNIKLKFTAESLALVNIMDFVYNNSNTNNYKYKYKYKYGFVNGDELLTYKRSFNKVYANIYITLAKYCRMQKRKTGIHPFIHISSTIIDFAKFKTQPVGSWFGKEDIWNYNPKGLWYSCGMSWINWINSYKSQTAETIKSYLDEDISNVYYVSKWLPMYVYEIKTDKLNIKRITKCAELFEFCETYKNPRATTVGNYIDWKRVHNDFDGLQICPFGGYCGEHKDMLKKLYKSYDYDTLGQDALFGKISIQDIPHLWHLHWETATGVIWKNYKALDYQRLV